MGDYRHTKDAFFSRGITLNSLRDEMHSLNMRMLLAMQNHNEEAQEEIQRQLVSVQAEINRMSVGSGCK